MSKYCLWHVLTVYLCIFLSFVLASRIHLSNNPHSYVHRALTSREAPQTAETRIRSASPREIAAAKSVVDKARAKIAIANKNRLAHPFQTNYTRFNDYKDSNVFPAPPPLFTVTAEMAQAAALLAEVEAASQTNVTKRDRVHKRDSTWWMANKDLQLGTWPLGGDQSYQVFRDVTNAQWATDGATQCVADGKTDCTAAINNAMQAGKRCGAGCNGSTTKQAILYFPPGTYLISGTIEIYFGTQMIGDAIAPPTILASQSFLGLGLFSVDHYVADGGIGPDGQSKEWYIDTANFYRQIRNFVFDLTNNADDQGMALCGLHYQVGQATSLMNLHFKMTPGSSTQQGIFAENGSGGYMSDMTFQGGCYGIYGGSQQFTAQRLEFDSVDVAVQLLWDWGWSWKSISINGGSIGFKLLPKDGDGKHNTGSIIIIDSYFSTVNTAVEIYPANSTTGSGTTGITLENIRFSGVRHGVVDTSGLELLLAGDSSVPSWISGPHYADSITRLWETGLLNTAIQRADNMTTSNNPNSLPLRPYFERAKAQYETSSWMNFISVKSMGAFGDGVNDDTLILREILQAALDTQSIVYFDAGTYVISDTLQVPPGSVLVGECWAQLAAVGSNFGDMSNPRPMLQIGQPGDIGSVEIQDLLFTSLGSTPGAILVEWNLEADTQGSAAMWDCHARLGGAVGTDLTSSQCPPNASQDSKACIAASLMMHITSSASAFLENVWLWGADHDIDDPDTVNDDNNMVQCSIYVGRGLLIESVLPTWLYGTASEHSILYQYTFYWAANIYATMIQTESPYYQPTPQPPAPLDPATVGSNLFNGDPDYSSCPGNSSFPGCDASWALQIVNSQSVYIAGAGLYSWFTSYDQSVCVDASNCQNSLIMLQDNIDGVQINNLITIGAVNMVYMPDIDVTISSKDNLNVNFHPFWSQITAYEDHGGDDGDDDDDDDDDEDLPDPGPYRSCSATFASLDDLAAAATSIPGHCVAPYTIAVLQANLTGSLNTYQNLVATGYDKYFKLYAQSVAKQSTKTVRNFVYENGNKYFTCVVGEMSYCCDRCGSQNEGPNECKYCFNDNPCTVASPLRRWSLGSENVTKEAELLARDGGGGGGLTTPTINMITFRNPEPCPPDFSQRGAGIEDPTIGYANSIWWTFMSDQTDNFYADLLSNTGIPKDKTAVGDYNFQPGYPCKTTDTLNDPCYFLGWDFSIPQANGFGVSDVTNPKDVVQNAIARVNNGNLISFLKDAEDALLAFSYPGDEDELIDAVSLPVLMISAAVQSMTTVDQIGEKIEEEKRKAIILAFISAILFFLPVAGEVLGTVAETADIASILSVLGAVGNAGLDIVSIVDQNGNDPLAIFDLVLAPLSIAGDLSQLTAAANIRRGMSDVEIAKLGKVSEPMANIQKIVGVCRKD